MIECECYNIEPVAAQVRIASEALAGKDKIESDRYAEENDKGRENAESSLHVETTNVLADRQTFHL